MMNPPPVCDPMAIEGQPTPGDPRCYIGVRRIETSPACNFLAFAGSGTQPADWSVGWLQDNQNNNDLNAVAVAILGAQFIRLGPDRLSTTHWYLANGAGGFPPIYWAGGHAPLVWRADLKAAAQPAIKLIVTALWTPRTGY